MNTIQAANTTFTAAASYNELLPKQLLALCKLLQSGNKFIKFKILQLIFTSPTKSHKSHFSRWRQHRRLLKSFSQIPPEQVTYLIHDSDVTGWVFNTANLTNYTISKFRLGLTTYYGPHDDILNISVAEWVEAVMYFTAYTQSLKTEQSDNALLDKIIAIIYRPSRPFYHLQKLSKDFNIDRRQGNNLYRFTKRTAKFANLPSHLKLAIFLQFEGAYSAFSQQFPDAFGSKIGDGEADMNSWVSLLMAMSNDIFGDYTKTQQIDAFTFFTKVNSNIAQSKLLEAKYKK